MRLIIVFFTALWYDLTSFGQVQADAFNNPRVVPKRFSRLWKRQDDLGYLEQCTILQFWDKQIGRVNVLAFFDSSWQYSHRQASMLRVLRERFDKTGLSNIQFFAINAAPSEAQYVDKSETDAEEKTWRQISPSEAEGRPPVVVSPEALVEALGPDIYFIQDTDELQIWSKLRAFRDQILVIDRCGRLTYQVIVPWSILHFPYVKAAILSTYKDEPCGHCQFQESPFDRSTTESNGAPSTTSDPSTLNVQTESNKTPVILAGTSTVDVQIENNDAQSMSEEPSTLMQTENTSTFETENSTSVYYLTNADVNYEELSNATNTDYPEDYFNSTKTTTDLADEHATEGAAMAIFAVTDKLDLNNITEQVSDTDVPTTSEISNSSSETTPEEPRLKSRDELESLDARDVLKSRSTNARSVSPNDGSDNHLEAIEMNAETSGEKAVNSLESDYLIPIRIIMRAPHVDEYSDRTIKAHEYLVLKTGEPNYHEHLDEEAKLTAVESGGIEEEHKPVRKKSEAVRRTFGKDESPGLYGEVADYWRSFGNEGLQVNAQPTLDDDDTEEDDEEDEQYAAGQETSFTQDVTSSPTTLSMNNARSNTESPYAVVPIEEVEIDNGKVYDQKTDFSEEVDIIDEEGKSTLIAHYSKLLPWLYYALAK